MRLSRLRRDEGKVRVGKKSVKRRKEKIKKKKVRKKERKKRERGKCFCCLMRLDIFIPSYCDRLN